MCIEMQELVYNHGKGRDLLQHFASLEGYVPANYLTRSGAARGLYEALRVVSRAHGQNPDVEVALQRPEVSQACGTGNNWRVIWESGPFEWAIALSFRVHGPWGFTEPYYGFDLCFTN